MDVSALITSVTGAADLARLLINERDRQKAAAIQIDFTDKITQAQIQLSQVLGTIIEKDRLIQTLSQRVRELETEQSEKARYKLAKIGTVGDIFAYELRPATELVERSDEPTHFLCQPCLDIRQHRSVLHMRSMYAWCPACKTNIPVNPRPEPTRRNSTGITRRDW